MDDSRSPSAPNRRQPHPRCGATRHNRDYSGNSRGRSVSTLRGDPRRQRSQRGARGPVRRGGYGRNVSRSTSIIRRSRSESRSGCTGFPRNYGIDHGGRSTSRGRSVTSRCRRSPMHKATPVQIGSKASYRRAMNASAYHTPMKEFNGNETGGPPRSMSGHRSSCDRSWSPARSRGRRDSQLNEAERFHQGVGHQDTAVSRTHGHPPRNPCRWRSQSPDQRRRIDQRNDRPIRFNADRRPPRDYRYRPYRPSPGVVHRRPPPSGRFMNYNGRAPQNRRFPYNRGDDRAFHPGNHRGVVGSPVNRPSRYFRDRSEFRELNNNRRYGRGIHESPCPRRPRDSRSRSRGHSGEHSFLEDRVGRRSTSRSVSRSCGTNSGGRARGASGVHLEKTRRRLSVSSHGRSISREKTLSRSRSCARRELPKLIESMSRENVPVERIKEPRGNCVTPNRDTSAEFAPRHDLDCNEKAREGSVGSNQSASVRKRPNDGTGDRAVSNMRSPTRRSRDDSSATSASPRGSHSPRQGNKRKQVPPLKTSPPCRGLTNMHQNQTKNAASDPTSASNRLRDSLQRSRSRSVDLSHGNATSNSANYKPSPEMQQHRNNQPELVSAKSASGGSSKARMQVLSPEEQTLGSSGTHITRVVTTERRHIFVRDSSPNVSGGSRQQTKNTLILQNSNERTHSHPSPKLVENSWARESGLMNARSGIDEGDPVPGEESVRGRVRLHDAPSFRPGGTNYNAQFNHGGLLNRRGRGGSYVSSVRAPPSIIPARSVMWVDKSTNSTVANRFGSSSFNNAVGRGRVFGRFGDVLQVGGTSSNYIGNRFQVTGFPRIVQRKAHPGLDSASAKWSHDLFEQLNQEPEATRKRRFNLYGEKLETFDD